MTYLRELGYSALVVKYVTEAEPNSMDWLTPSKAEAFGITYRWLGSETVFAPAKDVLEEAANIIPTAKDRLKGKDLLACIGAGMVTVLKARRHQLTVRLRPTHKK